MVFKKDGHSQVGCFQRAVSSGGLDITNIILLTPAMQRFIFINSTVVTDNSVHFKFTERERAYIPHIYLKPNRLTASQIEIFNETWCMSDFVEITNAKLVLKPFRREPP